MNKRLIALLTATSLALIAATASAADQQKSTTRPKDETLEEVNVAGTLIRGVAPGGSNVISMSKDQILATGAASTNEVLTNLPQAAGFFNQVPFGGQGTVGGNARTAIVRPNIRHLSGGTTTSGSQALILMDGHRLVGAGVGLLAVDVEMIPANLIECVETISLITTRGLFS